ncbi:MAG: WD40/YVTN/BNR-like repeat-containing protein [Halobacteriaceae archaeon]
MNSVGLSGHQVVSVHQTQTDDLYAGTRPAHIYTSTDGGDTWNQVESFETIPGKEDWTQNYMGPAQVRDIRTHKQTPSKLFVAIETAGVYVSPNGGRSWEYRGRGLDNDPHGLRIIGQDSIIATCGRGLYRTDNAGKLWYRLDTHQQYFWYQYFREGIVHDGTYYTSVMDRSTHRYQEIDDGIILVTSDGGDTFDDQEFPGHEDDYVNAWTVADDNVFGGTVNGQLIEGPDYWTTVDTVNATIQSLAVL